MNCSSPRQPPRVPHGQWIAESQIAAFERAGTDAHRIFSSDEAWIERFGLDLLLSYKNAAARDLALAEYANWRTVSGFAARRIFGKHLPERNEQRSPPAVIDGDRAGPLQTVARENRIQFALDFAAGYSAGLFIDQRANRAFTRNRGFRKLLNTFAYTCSFSVAAALGGSETVSIDLSRKSLDRGRENFRLNGLNLLDENRHRFYADDVLEFLPRLARKRELFDGIILDPPTFSRGNKGRRFQVESDFEPLLQAALELAAPHACILLSTNCTRISRPTLERIARLCLKTARRAADFHREPELPDIPKAAAAQTLWLMLK